MVMDILNFSVFPCLCVYIARCTAAAIRYGDVGLVTLQAAGDHHSIELNIN